MASYEAQAAYDAICETLDEWGWTYDADPSKLSIGTSCVGEDLRIPLRIKVNETLGIVALHSSVPIKIPASKCDAVAEAVARANWMFVDGAFDFDSSDPDDCKLLFRLTTTYLDSELTTDVFDYMLRVSIQTIDDCNDAFEDLVNGRISVAECTQRIKEA